jgi:DNA-binding transcriptional LysR family regulator
MDLRHLRNFLVVADQLNVTRASKLLDISQPALSRQIHDLEDELQIALFIREASGLRLTGAGLFLTKEAQSILDRIDLLVRTFSTFASQEKGRFTIGYDPGAISQRFFGTLARFGAHHPQIEVSIREQSAAQLLAALRADAMDIAVIPMPESTVPSDCERLVISKEPVSLVVSSAHEAAKKSGLELSEMANEVLVSYDEEIAPVWHEYALEACSRAGFKPARVIKTNSYSSMLAAIAAGQGYGILPKILGANRQLALTTVPVLSPILTMDTCAVWRRTSKSHSLPLFLEVLGKGRESAAVRA